MINDKLKKIVKKYLHGLCLESEAWDEIKEAYNNAGFPCTPDMARRVFDFLVPIVSEDLHRAQKEKR